MPRFASPRLPTGNARSRGARGCGFQPQFLHHIPLAREALEEPARLSQQYQGNLLWFGVLAVILAPVAEEYFFRGLLFRTLHRELGDWRALVLSAAFFAIVHPPLACIPVACMGVLAAWLFRSGRHLLPCIACHAAYNATVVAFGA